MPRERVASGARHAFETGALTDSDYIINDSERGFHQYADCCVIQLIINDVTLLDDALAPLYMNNSSWNASCATLRSILFENSLENKEHLLYTRYWHGYLPVSVTLLNVFDLHSTRKILKFFIFLSLLVLVFSARGGPTEVRVFAYSIAGAAAIFWALPYFGQSLSKAPADALVIIGLATFLFCRDRILRWEVLLPYSAGYGAGIGYLESWTGSLPTAAGFLFVAAYLRGVTHRADGAQLFPSWRFAFASLLAFAGGAGFTIIVKQVLALLLTDAPALSLFTGQLNWYISGTSDHWLAGRFSGLLSLLQFTSTLTYWSTAGAIGLWIAVVPAWFGALFLAWQNKNQRLRAMSDLLAFSAGTAAVLAWAILFPKHTTIHAVYMSRILILPIALGVAALLCQAVMSRGDRTRCLR